MAYAYCVDESDTNHGLPAAIDEYYPSDIYLLETKWSKVIHGWERLNNLTQPVPKLHSYSYG